MTVNSDSIYGTTYGPVQGASGIRTTAKQETVFVHIFDWPSIPLALSGLNRRVISVRMLATGQLLKFRQSESGIQIDLPAQAPDPNVSVLALRTL